MLEILFLYMVIKRVIFLNFEFELFFGRIVKVMCNDVECFVVNIFYKYSGLKRLVVIFVNVVFDCLKRVKNDMYCCVICVMVKFIVLI